MSPQAQAVRFYEAMIERAQAGRFKRLSGAARARLTCDAADAADAPARECGPPAYLERFRMSARKIAAILERRGAATAGQVAAEHGVSTAVVYRVWHARNPRCSERAPRNGTKGPAGRDTARTRGPALQMTNDE